MNLIDIKPELTYTMINKTFSLEQTSMHYCTNLINTSFDNITNEMYLYCIDLSRKTYTFYVNELSKYSNVIRNLNYNSNYFTSKYELSKNRKIVLSDIVLSVSIILNTCFKIKLFLQKLLEKYNYEIITYYLNKYSLVINRLNNFTIEANDVIIESITYMQVCENDYVEILELFPIGQDDDIKDHDIIDIETEDNIYNFTLN